MKNLIPFKATASTNRLAITANLTQTSPTSLACDFHLQGDLTKIIWPKDTSPQRQDELWKHTCLEVFFAAGSRPQDPYIEINCAPNGSWNAYSFSSYREGMAPANITVRLGHHEVDSHQARFQFDISSETPVTATLVGLTAVIEFKDEGVSYWSLHHPLPTANFHDKQGWLHSATR
ncbi:DOMON-like domain-containing protein [Bdellovibrio sp. 22V]|uniref:DOMON-like domain-containing protein n=1 Tax=Bdellovibrio TaxID=958 RepID=UPI0025436A1F|nr:DOMON-like domain-containing protein [Bdellovibrio sp. 22V]WII73729.1 DOMON-like domain-containing protein [Bdellovibrio sp. 22V]